jgi:hypothetical protein
VGGAIKAIIENLICPRWLHNRRRDLQTTWVRAVLPTATAPPFPKSRKEGPTNPISPLCTGALVLAFASTVAAAAPKQTGETKAVYHVTKAAPVPPNAYQAFLLGTTLMYRPTGGSVERPQGNLNRAFGGFSFMGGTR